MLTGPNGALPIIPTYWATLPDDAQSPASTAGNRICSAEYDFTKVSVAEDSGRLGAR